MIAASIFCIAVPPFVWDGISVWVVSECAHGLPMGGNGEWERIGPLDGIDEVPQA